MASFINAMLCALLAAAFLTVFGYGVARHVLPRPLATGAAPVVGWAVFSAATLPILTIAGFNVLTVSVAGLLFLAGGGSLVALRRDVHDSAPAIPLWSYAAAVLLALGPAAAL